MADAHGESSSQGMRTCSRCRIAKERSAFSPSNSNPSGLNSYCRECVRAYSAAYRGTGPALPPGVRQQAKELRARGQKRCSRCKQVKALSAFHKNKQSPDGHANNCVPCQRAYLRERRRKNPDRASDMDDASRQRRRAAAPEEYVRRRLQHRLSRHGLTIERYEQMLEEQGHLCALCGGDFGNRSPAIDHDRTHCSGARGCSECVRALLCTSCTSGLGFFRGDPALLLRAAEYIAEHRSCR